MKLTVHLSLFVLALPALTGSVRADPPDTPDNPYANLDPDGIPLAVTQGQDKSSDQSGDQQKQAEAIERARNWLLVDYEQQVQRRSAEAPGQDKTSNVYLELSLNKDLAKLAGLTPIDASGTQPSTLNPKPGFATPGSMALRPAPSPGSGVFAPLISPLSSPAAVSATQPFYTTTYSAPLPPSLTPGESFLPAQPSPAPAPAPVSEAHARLASPVDTIDMQTPGMVAAKTSILPGTPDLTLDSLPNPNGDDGSDNPQSGQEAQNPNELPQLPELPQVMDADRMHQQLNAKLQVQSSIPGQSTAQSQPPNPTPPQNQQLPPETPMPISRQLQLSPVHAPLPNPYDILNR